MAKPMFQHRHYVAIAAMLDGLAYELGEEKNESFRGAVAAYFAAHLADTNPRFDKARFMAAATGKPATRRDAA